MNFIPTLSPCIPPPPKIRTPPQIAEIKLPAPKKIQIYSVATDPKPADLSDDMQKTKHKMQELEQQLYREQQKLLHAKISGYTCNPILRHIEELKSRQEHQKGRLMALQKGIVIDSDTKGSKLFNAPPGFIPSISILIPVKNNNPKAIQ